MSGITQSDAPSWELLADLGGTAFTAEGRVVHTWAFDVLRQHLGPGWPRLAWQRQGVIPGELLLAGSHSIATAQLLGLATRLERFSANSSFGPVIRELRRNPTASRWRHFLLQLEVGRAGVAAGLEVSFEPPVTGTSRFADVEWRSPTTPPTLIETTSLFRDDVAIRAERYETWLKERVVRIEFDHQVNIAVELTAHAEPDAIEAWLAALNQASQDLVGDAVVTVSGPGVVARVQRTPFPEQTPVFVGAIVEGDAWRRLARTLAGKARQSAGPHPTWLRVDVLDGLWQFTPWAQLPLSDRLELIAPVLREHLAAQAHLEGVVLSGGPLVALSEPPDEDVEAALGVALRRKLSAHQVREMLIVGFRDTAEAGLGRWAAAYRSEPQWLDADLIAVDLPPVQSWRTPSLG